MKQMILMLALLGSAATAANAQFNSAMDNKKIQEDERRGRISNGVVRLSLGTETSAEEEYKAVNPAVGNSGVNMNTVQQFQGYRSDYTQRYYGGEPLNITETLRPFNQYDTSKNNGRCIGCGSGAITDHRRNLMGRSLE